jgi:glycosyltransferase involved in cell wall biosynthesis
MKKILLISNTSWSIYNFRYGLMKELKKNFNVSFCANYDDYTEKLKEDFNYYQVKIDRKGKNPIKDILLLFSFCKVIKREKFDLVINYTIKPNIYGALACRIKKTKCINVVTGMGHVFIKKNVLSFLVKCLYKISFNFAEKIIFLNKEDLNFFVENRIIKKEKAVLFPGEGININHFSPSFCKERRDSEFTFLYAGRMLKEKGVVELVKAFKETNKYHLCKLILVGKIDKGNPSAISEKEIKKITEDKNIKHYKETEDVRNFICDCDCLVLPSYKEGLPRILLEAFSMEKMIIATDISGCREIVEGVSGSFLTKPKDIIDLTKKMIEAINLTPDERKNIGKKGKEKIAKVFDEKIVIKKYLELINVEKRI